MLGLGNPGAQYEGTRHNRGREVVEELARRRGLRLHAAYCRSRLALDGGLVLATPETFMNRSGHAARCLVERHGLDPGHLLVVYDDLALPLPALRLRARGGPGGQKGIASVLESLRTEEIARLRLGVGPAGGVTPDLDWVEFVLSRFAPDEVSAANDQIRRAADACELWLEAGAEAAMNRVNRPDPPPAVAEEPAPPAE